MIYDQNFRQDAAGNPSQSWAKVDPSCYAQCFTGQAKSFENWCSQCQSLDHTAASCPIARPRKRPGSAVGSSTPPKIPSAGRHDQVCLKYNKFHGNCKFGRSCKFLHVCSSCKEGQCHSAPRRATREQGTPSTGRCATLETGFSFLI